MSDKTPLDPPKDQKTGVAVSEDAAGKKPPDSVKPIPAATTPSAKNVSPMRAPSAPQTGDTPKEGGLMVEDKTPSPQPEASPSEVQEPKADHAATEIPDSLQHETTTQVEEETASTATGPDPSLKEMLYTEFLPEKDPSAQTIDHRKTGTDTIIRISDLVKEYKVGWLQNKKFRALDGVSFDVKAGEIFGFLGPNGAGKTTTIKSILGITKPTSGSVKLFGCTGISKQARSHIGYFPEISYYYNYLSAYEVIRYYGKLCGLSGNLLKQRTELVLDIVGLLEHRNKLLKKFSKGMLQRVGLAQALINDPALLIMDEPTSGLDPIMKREMRDLIVNLNKQGKTIFLSSHELSEVEMICHRVVVLDKGKVVTGGMLSEILPSTPGLAVVVKSLPDGVAAQLEEQGATITRDGAHWVVNCLEDKKIYYVLAKLGANGCELVEVRPHKQTLEDYFVSTVSKNEVEA